MTHSTGVPFYRLPFAVVPETFDLRGLNPYPEKYEYDIGFSGHVVPGLQPGNWRGRVLSELKPAFEKAGIRLWHSVGKMLPLKEYRRVMARTKIWLSSLSSGSIVNPRYFEVMASGTTVLLCNRASNGEYEGLGFEDGVNSVMFDSLQELFDKLMLLLKGGRAGEEKRTNIIRQAFQFVRDHHSYKRRGEYWSQVVFHSINSSEYRL